MRKTLPIVLFHLCLFCPGMAEAYELVEVLSGDTILVKQDAVKIRLELIGIWVPRPPGKGVAAQYRGAEARKFVQEILFATPAYIKEVEPRQPGARSRKVRIRVGEEGELDLAVLLADAGLGLAVRTDPSDPDHLEAIYQAERDARRGHRGMHDGGYRGFEAHVAQTELDLGIGVISAQGPSARGSGIRGYLADRRASIQSSPRGNTRSGIHQTGSQAIRDWGSRMGLPPDASRTGW